MLGCVAAARGDQGATRPLARANRVETVRFADPRWPAVQVVRGGASAAMPPGAGAATSETVSFGDGTGRTVQVVRGIAAPPAAPPIAAGPARRPAAGSIETVRFGGIAAAVSVVRGGGRSDDGVGLFAAAAGGELDRVAFAVDGAESGHGSNPAMWRPEPDGPQGPMQVSAAAALDVGGGDRFDLRENRVIGRAYLARLYQRYGNWPDAVAAYNWGPGNLDQWIADGRPVDRLPLETARYLLKVLRDALLLPAELTLRGR